MKFILRLLIGFVLFYSGFTFSIVNIHPLNIPINFAKEKVGENLIIVVIFRKKNDYEFKIPLQGKYLADIKDNKSSLEYSSQKIGSGLAKNQLSDDLKRK